MKYANTANSLRQLGRHGDSMLVHMSPQEVGGLQAMARRHGTSMTVNPQTGLPEAFNLKNLIPIAAGAALSPFVGAPLAGLITGGIGTLMTGDLMQGIKMGLGAAGGAGLAGSVANLAAPATAASTVGSTAASAAPIANAFTSGAVPSLSGGALPPLQSFGSAFTNSAIPTPGIDAALGTAPQALPVEATTVAGNIAPKISLTQAPLAETAGSAIDYTGQVLPENAFNLAPEKVSQPGIFQNVPSATTQAQSTLPTYERIGEGFNKLVENPALFKDLIGENKMQLAMAAAPMLIPDPMQYETPGSDDMIRPYTVQVLNTSGLGSTYAPGATQERDLLKYKFTAGKPTKAAAGGLMAYQDGGVVAPTSDVTNTAVPVDATVNTTQTAVPDVAAMSADRIASNQTFKNIADVQRAAGISSGLQALNFAPRQATPRTPLQPRQPISYFGQDYGIKVPKQAAPNRAYAGYSPEMIAFYESKGLPLPPPIIGYDSYGRPVYAERPAGVRAPGMPGFGPGLGYAFFYPSYSRYGGMGYAEGGDVSASRMLRGPGDGVSDSIPAVIGERQPARLADGEYVIDARTVSEIGNGSSEAGAKKLKAMVDRVHTERKRAKIGKDSKADRHLPV